VRLYLEAGRLWLAWTIFGLRLLFVLPILVGQNPNLRAIPSLQHVHFLGESLTVNRGVPNPWTLLGSLTVLLVLIFVADASLTAWKRGDWRKAVIIGGSVEFFLFAGLVTTVSMIWRTFRFPQPFSLYLMGLVAMMGYELSRDVLRASQLLRELRATEAGLRENQAMLQASNTQISDLFGRLITAQETERTRIARDLHDDVSQRIAGLSITMSGLKRKLRDHPDNSDVILALTAMQRNTIALAEDIRHVSHDLHPGTLQHAGLVAALSSFCAEFEKVQAIAVTFSAGDDIGQVDADTALCLYRITQEALHNVAKHADA
jgi:signal transduction histidine kinase